MPVAIDADHLDAVIFDLDGVVTRTADVHERAWKRLFDAYLRDRADQLGEPFAPFSADDYRRFVDGKPRYDGVKSFLASRGIELPQGSPGDPPGGETVCALGNRKDALFHEALAEDGVAPYESTVALIRALRRDGVRTAVVSSSRNARPVLAAAGLEPLFDVVFDGTDAAERRLPGKPDPAVFTEAARLLGVEPARAAVVEDARAGVEAGRRGRFGVVIGVDRHAGPEGLRAAGADVVVDDLGEVGLTSVWALEFDGFDPAQEPLREALCTLGNGRMATRGAAPDANADGTHYPGTYGAGIYNRLETEVAGRVVETESLVNLPNWLPLTFRVEDGPWFATGEADLLEYRQRLDLRRGVLERRFRVRDDAGRVTRVEERRLVSMSEPRLAALRVTLTPEGWSGRLAVRSLVDGAVTNTGVARYRALSSQHLHRVRISALAAGTVLLESETTESRVDVAVALRTRAEHGGSPVAASLAPVEGDGAAGHELALDVREGEPVTVEKTAAIVTSHDPATGSPGRAAGRLLARAPSFGELASAHVREWEQLWHRYGFALADGAATRRVVNFHVFHLLQSLSRHTAELDAGVPARGLHGEAYHGHVFWDELFVFPVLNLRDPRLARALLRYRYRRLPEARAAAREAGYAGAMFPWQSASTGEEETQRLHLNPRSGRWNPDHSRLQRHVGAAIAYNVWQHYQVTGDTEFLVAEGAELILEIARFWASIASYDTASDRFDIVGVVGPDEYHEALPGSPEPGLANNTYTNVMATWVLCRALDVLELLRDDQASELRARLSLGDAELARWDEVSRKLRLVFLEDGIPAQFDGYERLEELDWDAYRERYGDIARLDRILEAEGDTTNAYKVSKQADVLMLYYLLSADELGALVERLGYPFDADSIPRTIDYYLARTSHGSTLSALVDAWVLARSDRVRSWAFFERVLQSDISDIQGGTTAEGIHLGAMAGTLDLVERCFTGLEIREDVLWLDPQLPEHLRRLEFDLVYRGHRLTLSFTDGSVRVASRPSPAQPISVGLRGRVRQLEPGAALEL